MSIYSILEEQNKAAFLDERQDIETEVSSEYEIKKHGIINNC